jgi:TatA/E family protein of Tat protein translocase
MPFNIQGPELILILIIALIVIGPGKLPDVGAALGRSIREFRKAASDVQDATSTATKPAADAPLKANELRATPSEPAAASKTGSGDRASEESSSSTPTPS